MNIRRIYGYLSSRRRPARMRAFLEHLQPTPETTILDVGGTEDFWQGTDLRVVLLNTAKPRKSYSEFQYVHGDATQLPYEDESFDIVFSNSTIEHLGTRENQERAAEEANRVGKALWIQTPNRWFPIEPHFIAPFIHWLPKQLKRRLLRNFTVWGLVTRPSHEKVDAVVDEIRLLGAKELKELFPGCRVLRERVLGMTKSFVVVRPTGSRISL